MNKTTTPPADATRVAAIVFSIIDVPEHYSHTKAHHLYGDRYRVNVHIRRPNEFGSDDILIHSSYYLRFDGAGIFDCKPPLRAGLIETKHYYDPWNPERFAVKECEGR